MAYHYMPFPLDRLEKIPEVPSEVFHESMDPNLRSSFFGWSTHGLDKPHDDLEKAFQNSLEVFKANGQWTSHPLSVNAVAFPPEKRVIGPLQIENVVPPWKTLNVRAIMKVQEMIDQVTADANNLLEHLISITRRLYGTENPWKGWPSILRASARGWALVILKTRLGSLYLNGREGSQHQFTMSRGLSGDGSLACPTVITTLLKELYIDGKVDLDENPMGFRSAEVLEFLKSKNRGDYMEEWESEIDNIINDLWPLHVCLKIMLGVY